MQYGPCTIFSIKTVDKMPPATPIFVSATQISSKFVLIVLKMPSKNADGSPLTGLSNLKLAYLTTTSTTNPFINKTMAQILSIRGVKQINTPLNSSDANTQKVTNVPISSLNSNMCFAASCYDETGNCSDPYVFSFRALEVPRPQGARILTSAIKLAPSHRSSE